jgi:hypothetical protein
MAITQSPPPTPSPSPDGPEHAPGDKEMTLLEHLEELRGRLVGSALGVVAGVLVAIIPVPGFGSITEVIVRLLAESGMSEAEARELIKRKQEYLCDLVTPEVAGLILAKERGLDAGPFIDEVFAQLKKS